MEWIYMIAFCAGLTVGFAITYTVMELIEHLIKERKESE